MEKEIVTQSIRTASEEVFSTMLGIQAACGAPYDQPDSPSQGEGVLALIGIAGPWIGTGTISCSPQTACKLSSLLLMTPYESVDNDVLDAMAEIANMIFGNVKTMLEEHVGPLGLSIPTVVFGKNFQTKQTTSQLWTGIPISLDGMQMEVRLGLTPNHETGSPVRHGFDHKFLQLANK